MSTKPMPKWLAYLVAAPALALGAALYLGVAWVVAQPLLTMLATPFSAQSLGGLLLGTLCGLVLFGMVTMPIEWWGNRGPSQGPGAAPTGPAQSR